MRKLVVVTKLGQVNGYRLAGVDAIGVNDIDAVQSLIASWLTNKEEILLALDDSLFSNLSQNLINKIYDSNDLLLVTIPDGPVSGAEVSRKKRIYEMIRHATGVQIRFKGESNGTKQ
jgi:vacuolar-type H+-ATPase subunit F/Vma7